MLSFKSLQQFVSEIWNLFYLKSLGFFIWNLFFFFVKIWRFKRENLQIIILHFLKATLGYCCMGDTITWGPQDISLWMCQLWVCWLWSINKYFRSKVTFNHFKNAALPHSYLGWHPETHFPSHFKRYFISFHDHNHQCHWTIEQHICKSWSSFLEDMRKKTQ